MLVFGCCVYTHAQSIPAKEEITLTPPRESEPWSESIGNDPSDAPPAIHTPVAVTPGAPVNTSPARATEVETSGPVAPVTTAPAPSVTATPVNTSPAKAVDEDGAGKPK